MENVVIEPRKVRGLSRVSNSLRELFVEPVDKRSATARRFKDVLSAIISDLGGGDSLSEGQRQLARRCALLAVECEKLEARSVGGEDIDVDRFGMMTDRLGRAFQRLGLRRVPKDVTPDLSTYLSQGARR